ncbi:MAG TPA: hypothetical protein VJ372_25740, partial [Pyrinomonadaceae bacterium]|nr:hypothetical protein [Pyrinomonadaceae bacterium]
TFVSSSEVTANITVADTAAIATFDIQVTNSDGRGGKGTELFKVTAKQAKTGQCPPMQPPPTGDTKCYAAMPGCLDSTFGGVGFVQIHIGDATRLTVANDAAIQPDGKVVVVGQAYTSSTSNSDFLVTRFNTDGSLDTSFGDVDPFNGVLRLGYTITAITTNADAPNAVALQPDGKIVVLGTAGSVSTAVVVRYNTNGTLDSGFGSGGKAIPNFGKVGGVPSFDIAVQSDGKMVIAGTIATSQINNGGFSLARLLSNGSLDSTFGSNGLVVAKPGAIGVAYGLAIQRVPAVTGEERIVVVGWSALSSNANQDWTVMRFTSNGTADTSFGSAGIVKTPFLGFGDTAKRVVIDSANRILVAGNTHSASVNCGGYIIDTGIARYTLNGDLDATFSGGKQTVDIYGAMDQMYGLALQPDDKVLLFGYSNVNGANTTYMALTRLNVDGSRDASFGLTGNGTVTLDLTGFANYGQAVGVQPGDGKIVVAGSVDPPGTAPWDMAVARYLP